MVREYLGGSLGVITASQAVAWETKSEVITRTMELISKIDLIK